MTEQGRHTPTLRSCTYWKNGQRIWKGRHDWSRVARSEIKAVFVCTHCGQDKAVSFDTDETFRLAPTAPTALEAWRQVEQALTVLARAEGREDRKVGCDQADGTRVMEGKMDEQARRDAMADAETLRHCHNAYVGLSKCWQAPFPPALGFACCDIAEARAWGEICHLQLSNGQDFGGSAEEAARAAFRACPMLRGE